MNPRQALTALLSYETINATADLRKFGGKKTIFQISRIPNPYGLHAYRVKAAGLKKATPILSNEQLLAWLWTLTEIHPLIHEVL